MSHCAPAPRLLTHFAHTPIKSVVIVFRVFLFVIVAAVAAAAIIVAIITVVVALTTIVVAAVAGADAVV